MNPSISSRNETTAEGYHNSKCTFKCIVYSEEEPKFTFFPMLYVCHLVICGFDKILNFEVRIFGIVYFRLLKTSLKLRKRVCDWSMFFDFSVKKKESKYLYIKIWNFVKLVNHRMTYIRHKWHHWKYTLWILVTFTAVVRPQFWTFLYVSRRMSYGMSLGWFFWLFFQKKITK